MKYRLIFFLLFTLVSMQVIAQDITPTQPVGVTIHVVQRGESLWRIAQTYNVSVDDIANLNGIPNTSGLEIGQRLLVPSSSSPSSTPAPTTITIQQPSETIHVVQNGETLFRIALQYGLTFNAVAEANNITDPSLIYEGQQLIIPNAQTTPTVLTLPSPLTNIVLNPTIFVEGQTGSITLTTRIPTTITGQFLGQDLHVITLDSATYAIMVGIPIFTTTGTYPVTLTLSNSDGTSTPFSFDIQVLSGGYLTTNITLSPEQEALLAPAVEEYEITTIENITRQFTPEHFYSGPLGLPAAAAMNAPFGTRRSYNGGAVTRFHNGADFAAAPGTPVLAAAAGRVVLADVLNIRGNATIIDHGWGLFTLYAHQSTINVKLGDIVEAGQVIGTSGATGRVTGPHLHWEVWLNGVAVDPLQWTQSYFP